MYEKLSKIVRRLDTDYEPYGKAERDGSDCSCGCRHFVKLAETNGVAAMYEKLSKIVRRLDTDYEPYGKAERDGSDCSCGCRHFVKLANEIGNDWGVCSNPESPRSGLLTFEHQGCTAFQAITVDPNLTDAQLRHLIGDASQMLQDRRLERTDKAAVENRSEERRVG